MSAPGRLAAYAAGLAVVLGGGLGVGHLLDPPAAGGETQAHGAADVHGAMGGMAGMDAVRGLAIAEHGLRLEVERPDLERGRLARLRFRVVGDDGRAVRRFDVTHTKRMHLIVVRRDLTGFQHLHPTMDATGEWTTRLRLDAAGSYRVFADFSHGGTTTTLAGDLRVDGRANLRPLPAPAATATSADGYRVRLSGDPARRGEEAGLRFAITRGGRPVTVEPYLGAGGHLVALREGDLAFLHVHPTEHRAPGGEIGFEATFPTVGRYRLFLQFQVGGRVQTVAFTEEVR